MRHCMWSLWYLAHNNFVKTSHLRTAEPHYRDNCWRLGNTPGAVVPSSCQLSLHPHWPVELQAACLLTCCQARAWINPTGFKTIGWEEGTTVWQENDHKKRQIQMAASSIQTCLGKEQQKDKTVSENILKNAKMKCYLCPLKQRTIFQRFQVISF